MKAHYNKVMNKIEFCSNVECGSSQKQLLKELEKKGFDTKLCFQTHQARYLSNKTQAGRFLLRLEQYIAYPIRMVVTFLFQSIQSIFFQPNAQTPNSNLFSEKHKEESTHRCKTKRIAIVTTNPFFAPFLATFFHPNVVHLIWDLYPETMIHAKKWSANSIKSRVVSWIIKKTLQRSQLNVFIGNRLRIHVEKIYGKVSNATVIDVGSNQSLFKISPKQRAKYSQTSSVPTILYCGLLGNLHDAETFLTVWRDWASSSKSSKKDFQDYYHSSVYRDLMPNFRFYCSGAKRATLEKSVTALPDGVRTKIHLGFGLNDQDWAEQLQSSEVSLITIVPGAETVLMPGRTYSSMLAGQALLAIAPEESDLVDLVKIAKCGWWVCPGDSDKLKDIFKEILAFPDELLEKRENAYQYAHKHLGQNTLAKKWHSSLKTFILQS